MTPEAWKNKLYFGDNLTILREHIPTEAVDLVYLDPPFNSNATYNVLFAEKSGEKSAAQITAFDDTWHWGLEAEATFQSLVTAAPPKFVDLMQALRAFLGQSDMMAYLTMMAVRLLELHRVLNPTGSLYLHCDPTASHYLKLLLDIIFEPTNFLNEIIWRRTGSHNSSKRFGPIHDVLLFYAKSEHYFFKKNFQPYMRGHVSSYFKKADSRGKFWTNALTGAGTRKGDSGKEWHGYNPTSVGRHWAIPGKIVDELGLSEGLTLHEKLDAMDEAGFIGHPIEGSKSMPTYRQYLDSSPGMPLQDIWSYQPHTQGCLYGTEKGIDEDVRWLIAQGDKERLGFPTQKPLGLLERIIESSCPPGGLVLDPFCGCGTTVIAAEHLRRRWIGIDITHLAISLMKHRLWTAFEYDRSDFVVLGVPKDTASARELAQQDRYHFEWWALGLVEARPGQDKKKGADSGVDGLIYFRDDESGISKKVVVQVKSGHVGASQIRDLKGVLEREKAALALFLTLEEPTRPMKEEAATAGFYEAQYFKARIPRIQIFTIEELLTGKRPELPRMAPPETFKRAERKSKASPEARPGLFEKK